MAEVTIFILVLLLVLAQIAAVGYLVLVLRRMARTVDEIGRTVEQLEEGVRVLALVMVEDLVARGSLSREEARALLAGGPMQPAIPATRVSFPEGRGKEADHGA